MAFNIAEFLNEESKKEMQDDFVIKKIPAENLHPSEKNFYEMNLTNSTQRERSDYCKMFEVQKVRELLEEYAQNNDLPGRKRDVIAGILNTSKSTIGKLDNIRRNIIPEFMEEYKAGKISTHAANQIAGADQAGQRELLERYKENGTIYGKEVIEYKTPEKEEQLPGQMSVNDYPEILQERAKVQETKEQQVPKAEEMTEPQTEVTIQRQQDITDRKSLVISGKINPNKEYNGMNVKYFADAITNSDLFDNDFWSGWVDPAVDKASLITNYQGLLTAFTADTGEPCQVEITNEVTVKRTEAAAVGKICIREFAELVDALILTNVVQIKTPEVDVPYWIKETAREIVCMAMYATQEELTALQEIALRMKERAGK